MTVNLLPSKLSGSVTVPPSKSMSHRALICAALSSGESHISNIVLSQDIKTTIDTLTKLGASFEIGKNSIIVSGINGTPAGTVFDCNESGSTLRFIIPIACAFGVQSEFRGKGKLPTRPITPYLTELTKNGIRFEYDNTMPFNISGRLKPGNFCINGDISSQFITGLLFALPLLDGDSQITVVGRLESRPYVDMTITILEHYGIYISETDYGFIIKGNQKYIAADYTVEGDYSQAAFYLVAAAIGNTDLVCDGLSQNSVQGDKRILDILKECGADVYFIGEKIKIFANPLKPFKVDVRDIPDLVPILTVLACFCNGTSKIYNAKRLRIKESDRILSATTLVNALGGHASAFENSIEIIGNCTLEGGTVDSFNDHRIAMAATVASTMSKHMITLTGADSVKKSYPDFYIDIKTLGGQLDVIDME